MENLYVQFDGKVYQQKVGIPMGTNCAPLMDVLFWGPGNFPVIYSNRDTSWNAWNRHSGKFYGQYGDLIQQYEVSLSRMLNDILTLDQQWLPNQSDFPPMSWPWYRLWPSPIYEWFPWSICNGCGMPAGNAYPSGHLVPSPIFGLANAPIVETKSLELAMSLLDFSPRIPLGTFSILPSTCILLREGFYVKPPEIQTVWPHRQVQWYLDILTICSPLITLHLLNIFPIYIFKGTSVE